MRKILTHLFIIVALYTNAQDETPVLTLLDSLHEEIELNYTTYNDLEKTVALCNKVLHQFPNDSLASIRKAGSLFYLHQTDDFISFVSSQFIPADSAASILGIFALQDDERSESDSALVWHERTKMSDAALKLSNKNVYANLSKALLEVDAKAFEKSLAYLQVVIDNAPPELAPNMRLIEAGIYNDFNKNAEAAMLLDKLIIEYPDFKEAYVQRISQYRRENKFDEALQLLEKEYAHFKDEADYLSYKFYILKQAERKEEACAVSETIGTENSYIADYSIIIGCKWNRATFGRDKGTTLLYEINTDEDTYEFSAKITENYDGGKLDFDFTLTSQELLNGHITISKSALDTAHTQLNQFNANMQNLQLSNTTAVWVSDEVLTEIREKGQVMLNTDGEWRTFAIAKINPQDFTTTDFVYTLRENDEEKRVPCIHIVATDDSGYELFIKDDATDPLILQMYIGFSVILREVKW